MSVVGDILPDDPVGAIIKRSGPITARPAWQGQALKTHREYNARHKGEWLPVPYRGRYMQANKMPGTPGGPRRPKPEREPEPPEAIDLMIVPGPAGLWQIVKLDLQRPLARGFRTKEQARGWIGRAVRAGILPEGVVEVEPPGSEP